MYERWEGLPTGLYFDSEWNFVYALLISKPEVTGTRLANGVRCCWCPFGWSGTC